MFKKRALLLFFLIISPGLFAEDSPLEIVTTAFESQPKSITSQGLIEVEDSTVPINIEINNRELFKTEIIIASEEELELPLEILNYELINREYSFLRSVSYKNLNSYRVLVTKPEIDTEEEENLIEMDNFPFEKIIYTVSNYPRVVLKKEYYREKNDREPTYVVEVDNILNIKDYHIITSFIIKNNKNGDESLVKLNIETLNFGESR